MPDHDNCSGALALLGPYGTGVQYSGSFSSANAESNAARVVPLAKFAYEYARRAGMEG